jgi:thiamine-monophosphate kinase
LPDLLGDDVAVLPEPPPGGRWAVTVDSQIAGVHHPADLDPALVARRLLAVNLSDLAATGADPAYAFLALSAPPAYDHRRFFRGLLAACATHGVTLAGGDLARTEPAVATLTLAGLVPADRHPLHRGAARPGDTLWVTGTLGESAAGRRLLSAGARAIPVDTDEDGAAWEVDWPPELADRLAAADPTNPEATLAAAERAVRRHLTPQPALGLGRTLADLGLRIAAMDLSDGLAADLPRLCRASGVGAEIDAGALPRPAEFAALVAVLGADDLDLVLTGGEDYALLFALPPDGAPPAGAGCSRMGDLTDTPEIQIRTSAGLRPLVEGGWDHLSSE